MDVGLYAAAHGMRSIEQQQEVIANNLANVSTPGFRRQEGVVEGFYEIFLGARGTINRYDARTAPGGGLKMVETFSNTANGPIVTTGAKLDAALEGPGFFGVETPFGERFTRGGNFSVDINGNLVTVDGHLVQDQAGGALTVGDGEPEFQDDGTVLVNGQPIGQLRIIEFEDPHMLLRQGEGLYMASDAALARSAPAQETRVHGRSLEQSNTQVAAEMIKMTLGARMYAANQRIITAIDDTLGLVINQVGTPR
jgi:flagellar basal-body rod protein FlgF